MDIEKIKDRVAISKGYPSWQEMENWIIDHSHPAGIAQLLVGAMEEVVTYQEKQPVMISMCDKTGIMARPWAEAGYTCICVDIRHSIRATRKRKWHTEHFEGGGSIHFMYGDARSWKPSDFDKEFHRKYRIAFVACFPVCTDVSGSGSQDWGHGKAEPLKCIPMLADALLLFNSCEQIADWSGAPYCIENPTGAIPSHHRRWDYIFHPWQYGDLWTKHTCLWTGNGFVMPPVKYITKPEGVTQKIWLAPPPDWTGRTKGVRHRRLFPWRFGNRIQNL